LQEVEDYVIANANSINHSVEDILEIFKKEMILKLNDYILYKTVQDKALNIYKNLSSGINNDKINTDGKHKLSINESINGR
ncbi:586_t:CDS:2, partial [Dentiscutata heterogama]